MAARWTDPAVGSRFVTAVQRFEWWLRWKIAPDEIWVEMMYPREAREDGLPLLIGTEVHSLEHGTDYLIAEWKEIPGYALVELHMVKNRRKWRRGGAGWHLPHVEDLQHSPHHAW